MGNQAVNNFRVILRVAGVVFSASLFCLLFWSCSPERSGSLEDVREQRRALRLYDGAPPVIPHAVQELGRRQCLSCHKGGNALKQEKLATITPHPNFRNCVQCHVPSQTGGIFRQNDFVGFFPVGGEKKANPLGPPYIPHLLQNRENCASCHLGKTSEKALRPRHGNRNNCTQCHVHKSDAKGYIFKGL